MRICLLTTSYPRSDSDEAGIFIKRLAEGYELAGASGIVIVPRDKSEPAHETQSAFSVHRYRYGVFQRGRLAFGAGIMPNIRNHPLTILQAPLLLLGMAASAYRYRNSYDTIHANWLPAALAAWLVSLLTRKPYIVTMRGEDMRLLSFRFMRLLMRIPLRQAKALTSVNESFGSKAQQLYRFDGKPPKQIPNGVDALTAHPEEVRQFMQRHDLAQNATYLLFIGSVIPRKRVHVLLDVLAESELNDAQLIVAGRVSDTNYMAELRTKLLEKKLESRIHFLGSVAPSEIGCCFSVAAAYLTASEFEGRSNSVLEAFASGCPVIASSIEAHRETIDHGKNGFLFDVQDPESTAKQIATLLSDQTLYQAIVSAGRDSVSGLSWKLCAEQYLAEMQEQPHS